MNSLLLFFFFFFFVSQAGKEQEVLCQSSIKLIIEIEKKTLSILWRVFILTQ